jgi:hypothetical protein
MSPRSRRPPSGCTPPVLARSESKARAVAEILHAESAELGARLRALVLCDFEEATATQSARLSEILAKDAGGARLALRTLLSTAPELDPVLMTGRTVAAGPETAKRLADWLAQQEPELKVTVNETEISAEQGWTPRRYVPLITRFFTEGGTRCLIGTRALLGEGWDAPSVNVVIDLTAATTPTSVVQARGRALRRDDQWPAKVADNWAVVCVTAEHPKGAADYDRFVRKHDRYFALSRDGDIISGVAHVDPALSPYAPPDPSQTDAMNALMLTRAGERDASRESWAIGTSYADEPVATVVVAARRPLGITSQVSGLLVRRRTRSAVAACGAPIALVLAAALAGGAIPAVIVAGVVLAAGLAFVARTATRVTAASPQGSLDDMAAATAEALHQAGLTSGDAVRIETLPDGSYRASLRDVPAPDAAVFTTALDEVLSPLAQPRYVIPRLVIPPASASRALTLAARRLAIGHVPARVVYHAVPSVLGTSKPNALAFQRAWNTRVSPGLVLYTGSAEGTGILAAQRGDDPFAITTQMRTLWR